MDAVEFGPLSAPSCPLFCVTIIIMNLLSFKFLSKENKILKHLSSQLLAVRNGRWGFFERKMTREIEYWVSTCWHCGC
jgi:hypothetical protein